MTSSRGTVVQEHPGTTAALVVAIRALVVAIRAADALPAIVFDTFRLEVPNGIITRTAPAPAKGRGDVRAERWWAQFQGYNRTSPWLVVQERPSRQQP